MNITHKELCRLYQDYHRQKNRDSPSHCLCQEELLAYFVSGNQIKKNNKIFAHLKDCPSCARDFAFLMDIKKGEDALIGELEALREENPFRANRGKGSLARIYSIWPRWQTAIKVVQLLVFTALLFLFFKIFPQHILTEDSLRTTNQHIIKISDSSTGILTKSNLMFSWNSYGLIKYYFLDVYDENLTLIWRSERLVENHCLIPVKAANNWRLNKSYFWMVIGYEKNGDSWESPLAKFILVD